MTKEQKEVNDRLEAMKVSVMVMYSLGGKSKEEIEVELEKIDKRKFN